MEMPQLIPLRLLHNQPTPLAHSIDTPQIRCGIQIRVWSFGEWDVWQIGILGWVAVRALHAEGTLDPVTVGVGREMGVTWMRSAAVFPREQTHGL